MVSLDARYSAEVFGRRCEAFRRRSRAVFAGKASKGFLFSCSDMSPGVPRILALCSTGAEEAKAIRALCSLCGVSSKKPSTQLVPEGFHHLQTRGCPNAKKPLRVFLKGFDCRWLRGQDLNL